ncbi:MAG: P-loop NTPase fold protein [Xenococcus sp. MO_188.B8]|nr:P-loop NTPase fold protein [Xenococcus sp. MO_188.B8]
MSGNETRSVNSHIEDYLDYYCGLSHSPGFAVLLKGEWGCGKTWFINKYLEKLKQEQKKSLYVSLYGMTSFSDIEDAFFQQLHPVLSSKGMAITGKILKGLLKGTLKIDLDGDKNDDGSVTVAIPEINLPDYLKNTDKSILIFDDLERCQIDIGNLLGYINYFVEHQGLKVILVANEEKLLKDDKYKDIKEKLIGKTFDVCFDLDGALKDFIEETNNQEIENFLSDNIKLIEELYEKAEYTNLRCLKQIILDFERIFQELPEKARNKSELPQEILQILIAFSIEIKRGTMLPQEISNLENEYVSKLTKQANFDETAGMQSEISSHSLNIDTQEPNNLQKMFDRYNEGFLNFLIYQPLPNLLWWQTFFDKGIINSLELEESTLNSKYFQDEDMPKWMRLCHFLDLSDQEFDNLLKEVELQYTNREFKDIGVIKHITGLFLYLSNIGLFSKNKQDLLKESKLYIDDLIAAKKLDLNPGSHTIPHLIEDMNGYKGLGFIGKELIEFREFCSYTITTRQSAIEKSYPELGIELLEIMQNDLLQFYRMICLNDFPGKIDNSYQVYSEIPIFKYIEINDFMEKLLSMSFGNQKKCLSGLRKRYRFTNINKKLIEELDWLKNTQNLLLDKADRSKGKLSGYKLQILNEELNQAIVRLELLSTDQEVI